jgi:hypothetical protein
VISTELGYPIRISYAYTYLNEGRRIFRYDNAPFHPEITTFRITGISARKTGGEPLKQTFSKPCRPESKERKQIDGVLMRKRELGG